MVPLQNGLVGPETLPLLLIVAGLGLSIAEALAPGTHFVVVGVALLAAGLVGLLLGSFASPFVLALLVLLFGALALYGYRELDLYGGKGQPQTRDSLDLKGKTGRVVERVTPTSGEIKVAGGGFSPYYSARTMAGEIPEGEEVMIIDPGGGNVVTVESLGAVEDDIDRELARGRAENARRMADGESATAPDRDGEAADGDTDREPERERN
jgi:membrane protein implicated in regulation of membrane protease activity